MQNRLLSDYKYIGKNGRWIITSLVGKNGKYVYARVVDHPFATSTGYVLEHRAVMENYLGRFLNWDEIVKHLDGNTHNNKIENLIVIKWSDVARTFGVRKLYYDLSCPECKRTFQREGRVVHRYQRTNQLTFCSRVCSSVYGRSREGVNIEQFILSKKETKNMDLECVESVIFGHDLKAKSRFKQESFYKLVSPRARLEGRNCLFCKKDYKPQNGRQRYCTEDCAKYGTRKFQVSDQELLKLAKKYSFLALGKKFGVSDNAIRKRCKKLGFLVKISNKWQIKDSIRR
jgi:uncharacterized protein (DUF1330 family)